jgi:hypothetical protein
MDNAKPINTPMSTNGHLDLDMGGTSVDQKVYCSMIGFLLYFMHLGPISCLVCVCVKIPSCTQRLSFKSGQENNEVSSSHT